MTENIHLLKCHETFINILEAVNVAIWNPLDLSKKTILIQIRLTNHAYLWIINSYTKIPVLERLFCMSFQLSWPKIYTVHGIKAICNFFPRLETKFAAFLIPTFLGVEMNSWDCQECLKSFHLNCISGKKKQKEKSFYLGNTTGKKEINSPISLLNVVRDMNEENKNIL